MKKLLFGLGLNKKPLSHFWLLVLIAAITSCGGNDLQEVEKVSLNREKVPQETGESIEVIYTDSSLLKARVMAPVMEKFNEKDKTYLEMPDGVEAYFFNNDEERNSHLRANYGIRYLKKNETVVEDDVVVVNKEGDTLRTEKLTWDEKKGKIYSDQFVKVKTAEEIILANGFESNPTFTNYEFYDIEGTIQIDE